MNDTCAETDYVNCKFGNDPYVCITHDRRGPSVQSELPKVYMPLAVRRSERYAHHAEKKQMSKNPKLRRLIFRTVVIIKEPMLKHSYLPKFDLEKKQFVRVKRVNTTPETFYTTIAGVAKPGDGIEIKERK